MEKETVNMAVESCSEAVTKILIEKNITITFFESCTSGLLASMFTDTEGASAAFTGSFVAYDNKEKIRLGVSEEVIESCGVYSKECAADMARAAQEHFGTDISVGITGNTGNADPKNPEGSIGEAFFCIRLREKSFEYHIKADVSQKSRQRIKKYYADIVYDELYKLLNKGACE